MRYLKWLLFLLVIATIPAAYFLFASKKTAEPIRVGILHSLTGTMAISELSVVDATLLAIEEINQQGGVLGRLLEPHVVDGKSDPNVFGQEAERLIKETKVDVIFGCWTSASRKKVKEVVEKHNSLLFYPVQYEGLEMSPNIVYTGAAPNQQMIPGVRFAFEKIGKRYFLVGSDYVYPHAANAIMKDEIASLGGEVVGEEYLPLGSAEAEAIVQKIALAKPDVIINTLNGDSNIAFFKALRAAAISSDKIPTISFSIGETELGYIGLELVQGDYAVWSYFQSVTRDVNYNFIERFRSKFGQKRMISDPMEAGYFGVHLWAQSVNQAASLETASVKKALKNQVYNAPEGIIYVDAETQHTWKLVRVSKIRSDGNFDILWGSHQPIKPIPYPTFYRDVETWNQFLNDLYKNWGNEWSKKPQ